MAHGTFDLYLESNMSNDKAKRSLNETLATAIADLGRTPAKPVDEVSDQDLDSVSGGLQDSSNCGGMTCAVWS